MLMQIYRPGDNVGALEDWPFDNPASNYRILEGAPRASGRIDAGGPGQDTRLGIWRCSVGTFECTEQGDEIMTILAGACHVTDHASGETRAIGVNDTMFMRNGARVTWQITEEVTKVFFGHKPDGF